MSRNSTSLFFDLRKVCLQHKWTVLFKKSIFFKKKGGLENRNVELCQIKSFLSRGSHFLWLALNIWLRKILCRLIISKDEKRSEGTGFLWGFFLGGETYLGTAILHESFNNLFSALYTRLLTKLVCPGSFAKDCLWKRN